MARIVDQLRRWVWIAQSHDTFWLELCLAGVAFAWAKTVWLMPGDLSDHAAYTAVARFAPDELWDTMGCVGATVQVAAAFRHGRLPRFLVAVLMCGFWLVLADGVRAAPAGFTPSVVPYYGLAASNGVCALLPLLRRLPRLLRWR